jgi:ATP-binding cassette subfamily F protein 3
MPEIAELELDSASFPVLAYSPRALVAMASAGLLPVLLTLCPHTPPPRSQPPRMMASSDAAIAIRNLDVWAGSSPLILDVNWNVMPNERWALLGGNGCGKSTLLRAIAEAAGGESFEDGELQISSSLKLGMLEQTAVSGSESSVREEVMSRMTAFQSAVAALAAAEKTLEDSKAECMTAELEALETAQSDFEAAGGFAVEARVAKVLTGLGFAEAEFDRPVSSFSGGWQMRVGLARLLLSDPSLLVLDEPTNHLDAAARRWLGEYVGSCIHAVARTRDE